MRCTSPHTVGFQADGTTLSWTDKTRSKEYATFQLPCSKCIECRLEYARQWAVRCVHESQMHENNSFITLTYSDEHLKSPRLQYQDFQLFMKKLRKLQNEPMGLFVTGEYGEKNKRPHWHALIFNWAPRDQTYLRSNERGDRLYQSETLDRLWGFNNAKLKPNEIGAVTMESAGYCARYAAKKLVHGKDGLHDFNPISKKSSKNAIGKAWIEQYWPDVFSYGRCVLRDGTESGIPRYYEKWFKEKYPENWIRYVTEVKLQKMQIAQEKSEKIKEEWLANLKDRFYAGKTRPKSPDEIRKIIIEDKFQKLQQHLKL